MANREVVQRGAVAVTIAGAHVGLIALFAFAVLAPRGQTESPPLLVQVMEQIQPKELPRQIDPQIVPVKPMALEIPPVEIKNESEDAIKAVVITEAPAPLAIAPAVAAPSGDAVSIPSISDVAYVKPPSPHYPSESRRAREEGLVVLRVLIDESGHASTINVYRSSGHPRLDEAARDAVRRAVFKPYVDGGTARAAIAVVPVEFSLHS
jgi:periplasmic protein TonB